MRADQLHDLLADARSSEPPADAGTGRAGVARLERRRRLQHATVVALLLVAGAAAILVGRPFSDEGAGVDTAGDPAEVPRLIPDPVPAGLAPSAFRDFPDDLATGAMEPQDSRVWLWRPAGADGWDEAVAVQTMVLPEDVDSDPFPDVRTTSDGLSSLGRAQDGVAVAVMSRGREPEALAPFLATVAVDDAGDLDAAEPPDGWELVVDGERTDVTGYGVGFDRPAHSALWTESDDIGARHVLVLTAESSPAAIEVQRFLLGGEQRAVEVDGTAGWLIRGGGGTAQSVDGEGNEQVTSTGPVWQVWWHRDGVVVLVEAVGVGEDEALAVARSVRPASDEEWEVLRAQGSAPGTSGGSCTVLPDGSQECSTGSAEGQGTPIDPGPTTTAGIDEPPTGG